MAAENIHRQPLSGNPPLAIVGAGRLAQALGRALVARGERVSAVAARDRDRATQAAAFISPSTQAIEIHAVADAATHVLVAVSDDAIEAVTRLLSGIPIRSGVVLHTSGARGPHVLAPLAAMGAACGVFHPLQTVPNPERGAAALEGIAFGIAGDERAVAFAERLARTLRGRSLKIAADRFAAYHAGAVMAGNHLIAVVDAAVALFRQAGLSERDALDAMAPLCRASLANTLTDGPVAALTGPVIRGDAATVATHVTAAESVSPGVAALYRAASRHLIGVAGQRGLSAPDARRIEAALDR